MGYLVLKYLHVVAAIIALGTNLTYLYWLRAAKTPGPPSDLMLNGVQWLDRRLANPAYIVLPITGISMVLLHDLGFTTLWIALGLGLYIAVAAFAGIVFTPALKRMVELAAGGEQSGDYEAVARRTVRSGAVILVTIFAIEFVMVVKPG